MMKEYKGKITKIIGVVADVRFDTHLPALNELLRVPTESGDVSFEVVSQLDRIKQQ